MRCYQKSSVGFGLLLILLQGYILFVYAPLFAAEIQVSPSGSDEHSGSTRAGLVSPVMLTRCVCCAEHHRLRESNED